MKKRKLLPLLIGLTLTACNGTTLPAGNNSLSSTNTSIVTSDAVSSSDTVITSSEEKKELEIKQDIDTFSDVLTFNDLFDLNNKIEISVDISNQELEKLQADYLTGNKVESYRHCDSVTISVTKNNTKYTSTYYDVGIRQKGNTSRDDIYSDGKLNLNHFKLSFDETFDSEEMYGNDAYDWSNYQKEYKARGDRSVLGLSALDIKWNKNYDSTHVKEIYASKIYEANGILSQHIGLTTFAIKNGNDTTSFGLCSLMEPASKSLIKRSLQSGVSYMNFGTWKQEKAGTYGVPDVNYGDLYKASYGNGEGASGSGADLSLNSISGKRIGIGNISGSYIPAYERKTNTDVNYDDHLLKELVQAISTQNYNSINEKIDLDYLAKVEACNYIIGNPDDLRNNNNNYLIYFRRTDGKAVIVPYDNDRCFGIIKDYNPDGNAMMDMSVTTRRKATGGDVNDLLKYTTLADGDNLAKTKYYQYVEELSKSDYVKNETFESLYNVAKNTYGNDSCSSPIKNDLPVFSLDDSNNKSFNEYMSKKLTKVNEFLSLNKTPEDGNYGDIYLNGSFADWNAGKSYHFTYGESGIYTLTFTPNKVDNGKIKCKIYDGEDYSRIDWAIDENGKLTFSGANYSSFEISNVTTSSNITITLNTISKTIEIAII